MLFAEILRIGYFPMIAGHENRMDDCFYVFQVNIGQNSYEPQLVQALANFFRLLYNVLMRHLLFTSADTPVEGVACIETLRDDSEITCLSREERLILLTASSNLFQFASNLKSSCFFSMPHS